MGSRALGGETRRVLTLLFIRGDDSRKTERAVVVVFMGWLSLWEVGGWGWGWGGASVWLNEKTSCGNVISFGWGVFLLETRPHGCPVCLSVCLAAGMNMSPVSRLKKTWSKVKTAKFDILEVRLKKNKTATALHDTTAPAGRRSAEMNVGQSTAPASMLLLCLVTLSPAAPSALPVHWHEQQSPPGWRRAGSLHCY